MTEHKDITRCFPSISKFLKSYISHKYHKTKLQPINIMNLDDFNKKAALKNDYKKYKQGYNASTRRFVKNKTNKNYVNYGRKMEFNDFFEYLEKIDYNYSYYKKEKDDENNSRLAENKRIDEENKRIDDENKQIDEENKCIKEYNSKIIGKYDEAKIKYSNLKWNEYIEFEGIRYGIPEYYDNIHRENDCNGNIILVKEGFRASCDCMWSCQGKFSCSRSEPSTYKCVKCEKEYLE